MANRPLTNIGEVIRNGVVFDFKNWQGGTVNADHLPDAVAHLFSLFETNKVDYVLVGGIALLQYVEDQDLWRWALPDSEAVNAAIPPDDGAPMPHTRHALYSVHSGGRSRAWYCARSASVSRPGLPAWLRTAAAMSDAIGPR